MEHISDSCIDSNSNNNINNIQTEYSKLKDENQRLRNKFKKSMNYQIIINKRSI